ncbi:hypothetical protein D3C76_991250 [compost metagenome]
MPRIELAATTPTEKRAVWPWRIISGTAILVNTAAEAMLTPVMAANVAFEPTVAMPRPPRTRRNSHSATSKESLPTPQMATSMPIRTNSGTTPNR